MPYTWTCSQVTTGQTASSKPSNDTTYFMAVVNSNVRFVAGGCGPSCIPTPESTAKCAKLHACNQKAGLSKAGSAKIMQLSFPGKRLCGIVFCWGSGATRDTSCLHRPTLTRTRCDLCSLGLAKTRLSGSERQVYLLSGCTSTRAYAQQIGHSNWQPP